MHRGRTANNSKCTKIISSWHSSIDQTHSVGYCPLSCSLKHFLISNHLWLSPQQFRKCCNSSPKWFLIVVKYWALLHTFCKNLLMVMLLFLLLLYVCSLCHIATSAVFHVCTFPSTTVLQLSQYTVDNLKLRKETRTMATLTRCFNRITTITHFLIANLVWQREENRNL